MKTGAVGLLARRVMSVYGERAAPAVHTCMKDPAIDISLAQYRRGYDTFYSPRHCAFVRFRHLPSGKPDDIQMRSEVRPWEGWTSTWTHEGEAHAA